MTLDEIVDAPSAEKSVRQALKMAGAIAFAAAVERLELAVETFVTEELSLLYSQLKSSFFEDQVFLEGICACAVWSSPKPLNKEEAENVVQL